MNHIFKTKNVDVDVADKTIKCTVHWELIIETRDWGLKSLSPMVTQIELEDGTLIKPNFDTITINVDFVKNGEALLPVAVLISSITDITVFFEVSL
jgi:hypothetical protein